MPKITLILQKGNNKRYLRRSVRKTQYFLRIKAESYLKKDYLITIKVTYEDGSNNSGTYDNIEDLKWAFNTFVKEYV